MPHHAPAHYVMIQNACYMYKTSRIQDKNKKNKRLLDSITVENNCKTAVVNILLLFLLSYPDVVSDVISYNYNYI